MRFAIAITILLCQPVPVPALAKLTISTNRNEMDDTQSLQSKLLNDRTISSHLLRKDSSINSAIKNKPDSLLTNIKECNPGYSYDGGGVGDMGILGCGINEYCIESRELSSLGGICIPEPDLGRTLQLYATPEDYCDPSSIFYENCDCSQFDRFLNQGSILCSPVDYYCIFENLCGGITTAIQRSPEGSYYSEVCYNISYPYDIPICYLYDSRATCSISVGDIECMTCNVVDVSDAYGISYGCFEFDCTNTIANLAGNDCRSDYITEAVSRSISNISPSSLSLVPTEPTASTVPPSMNPTEAPSSIPPTLEPTRSPTTPFPTIAPTMTSTSGPTLTPTRSPLPFQTSTPTTAPSTIPTAYSSFVMTSNPSINLSSEPTTDSDARDPGLPSSSVSIPIPISLSPTPPMTNSPSSATPSLTASLKPSNAPSGSPLPLHQSMSPSLSAWPSNNPSTSVYPSVSPSSSPSSSNTPTSQPSFQPSESVSPSSTNMPTVEPSFRPSTSTMPSGVPSLLPSNEPTDSSYPSLNPSSSPTNSGVPSRSPSSQPSGSSFPSLDPSSEPTKSGVPSLLSSNGPSESTNPSLNPSSGPSRLSSSSSTSPTGTPSGTPSGVPSSLSSTRNDQLTPTTPVISGPSSKSPVAPLVSLEKESISSSSSKRSQGCYWEIQMILPISMFSIFLYYY